MQINFISQQKLRRWYFHARCSMISLGKSVVWHALIERVSSFCYYISFTYCLILLLHHNLSVLGGRTHHFRGRDELVCVTTLFLALVHAEMKNGIMIVHAFASLSFSSATALQQVQPSRSLGFRPPLQHNLL
jgi:hypothetical protein